MTCSTSSCRLSVRGVTTEEVAVLAKRVVDEITAEAEHEEVQS